MLQKLVLKLIYLQLQSSPQFFDVCFLLKKNFLHKKTTATPKVVYAKIS